jgi:hypothetical protein
VPYWSLLGFDKLNFLEIVGKCAIIGVIFFIPSRNLSGKWNRIQDPQPGFDFLFGFFSFVFVMLSRRLNVRAWQTPLAGFHHLVAHRDVFIIFLRANPGKYLRGDIWRVAGSAHYAAGKGLHEGAAIAASVG